MIEGKVYLYQSQNRSRPYTHANTPRLKKEVNPMKKDKFRTIANWITKRYPEIISLTGNILVLLFPGYDNYILIIASILALMTR